MAISNANHHASSRPSAPRDRAIRRLTWPTIAMLASIPLALFTVPDAARAGGFLEETKPSNQTRPQYAEPAERKPVDDVDGDPSSALEAELYNAKLRADEALQNAIAAEHNRHRAVQRRYPRGEQLQALRADAQAAWKERREAEQAFVAALEKARRGGVPAGTLSSYMDFADWLSQQQSVAPTAKRK